MNLALPPDDPAPRAVAPTPAAPAMPPPTGKGPLANLEVRLAAGAVRADAEQRRVADRLQALHDALRAVRAARRSGGLLRFLGLGRRVPVPAGVYIWGPVGTGTSM